MSSFQGSCTILSYIQGSCTADWNDDIVDIILKVRQDLRNEKIAKSISDILHTSLIAVGQYIYGEKKVSRTQSYDQQEGQLKTTSSKNSLPKRPGTNPTC
jgi:hypothetical protein